METRPLDAKRWSLTAAVLVGGLMLSGCASAEEAEGAADDVAVVPEEVIADDVGTEDLSNEDPDQEEAADELDGDDLPDCDRIRSILGLDDLVYAPDDDGDHRFEDPTRSGITCAWYTPDTFEKANAHEMFADPGEALVITLQVENSLPDEPYLRELGWVADDPRLDEHGGFVNITLLRDDYDVDAPLSLASPTVYIGRFSSYIATMNALLIAEQNQLTELTNSWAIDQAIAIYDSL